MSVHLALLPHQTPAGSCRKSHQNGPFGVVCGEMDSVSLWEGKWSQGLVPCPGLALRKARVTTTTYLHRLWLFF